MARIEILVEEKSMEELLRIYLPKILPAQWLIDKNYFIRIHNGKSDLQKSIPRKVKVLSNWYEPAGVIILQDQDSFDCRTLKNKIATLCEENGTCPFLIRIVCKELESWYLGDFDALQQAFGNFNASLHRNKSKFRIPDHQNAFNELIKILPEFQKVGGAKKIAPFLNYQSNKSESFKQFSLGIISFFDKF